MAGPLFKSRTDYVVNVAPYAVAIKDLNGDGIPDVVATNSGNLWVNVFLGNGDGTFKLSTTWATSASTGSDAYNVTIADVNGDGVQDIVLAMTQSNKINVLLGNGNGTFQAPIVTSTGAGSAPLMTAVADFNEDGKADVAFTDDALNLIGILLGNGNGTFHTVTTFAAGTTPAGIAVADINGDGHQDVVCSNYGSNTVSVLLGNGNGTLKPQVTYAVPGLPMGVVLADVNGDGVLDIVVSCLGGHCISVLLGNGDGTFKAQKSYPISATASVQIIAAADIDGNGTIDIAGCDNHAGANSLVVLLGNGDGSFKAAQTYATGTSPRGVAVADLNADNALDVVTANVGNSISVLLAFAPTGTGYYTSQNAGQNIYGTNNIALWSNRDNTSTTANLTAIQDALNRVDREFDQIFRAYSYATPIVTTATDFGYISDLAAEYFGVLLYEARGLNDHVTTDASEEMAGVMEGHRRHVMGDMKAMWGTPERLGELRRLCINGLQGATRLHGAQSNAPFVQMPPEYPPLSFPPSNSSSQWPAQVPRTLQ